jgi:hypothetical protein
MSAEGTTPLDELLTLRCMANIETTAKQLGGLLLVASLNNVKIFRSREGHLIGYIAWASVTKETLRVMRHIPYLPRYPYEMHEGRFMVVFDFVVNPIFAKEARTLMVQHLKTMRFVAILRRNRLHAWMRIKGTHVRDCRPKVSPRPT